MPTRWRRRSPFRAGPVVGDISHEGLRVLLREEGVTFQRDAARTYSILSPANGIR
jgi:hypothetical protein